MSVAAMPARQNSVLALTPLQNDILFYALRQPESRMYVEQLSCILEGEVNVSAFTQAWERLVDRHDALRTGFDWRHYTGPRQMIHQHARLPIEILDWSGLDAAGQSAALTSLRQQDRVKPFDLAQPPLARVTLAHLAPKRHALLWTYHHLILDGWSVGLLMPDLMAIYVAIAAGQTPVLEPACSFAPYIRWLARLDMGDTLEYWRNRLDGFSHPTIVPRDRDEEDTSSEAGTISLVLPQDEGQAIHEAAQMYGCPSFTVVAAAWATVLATITSERDVMFGATVSGRPCSIPTIESMIGLFINTIPFRIKINPQEDIKSWLHTIEDEKRIAVDRHSYASLTDVLKPLRRDAAGADRTPFNTLLVYENYPLPHFIDVTPDLKLRDIHGAERMNHDITLFVVPSPNFELTFSFDTSRFTRLSMRRLLAGLRSVLERLCKSSAGPACMGKLLAPADAERHRVLVEYARGGRAWQHGSGLTPPDVSRSARIEQLVWNRALGDSAQSIAVSCAQVQWTYTYLYQQACAVAERLRAIGIRTDDRVGLCVRRGPWLVAGALGIMEAGGCYVPLDVCWPVERRHWIASDAGLKAVLVDEDNQGLSWGAPDIVEVALGAGINQSTQSVLGQIHTASARSNRDLAYVIYTSGSTGKPKGVMVEHAAVVNRLQWTQRVQPFSPHDRVLQKTPATFDISVWELFLPLIAGARVVLALPDGHRDPRYLVRELRRRRIGTVHFVASMLDALLQDPAAQASGGLRSPWLQNVVNGGEALSFELTRKFWTATGAHAGGPYVRFFNLYGPTEATVEASAWECEPPRVAAGEWSPNTHGASVPIGRPIDGIRLYVLDSRMRALPPGAIGELCIGGIGVARGYLSRPALTARYFVPDPFGVEPSRRLYCTGDLARWRPDGALDFLGRIDHQIKIRGIRVEPGEIEQTILLHPAIQSAVVVPVLKDDGSTQLAAYVVRRQHKSPWNIQQQELLKWLRERLPAHLLPSVLIDIPDSLPVNASGKLDRRALPAPERAGNDASDWQTVMSLSALEEIISEVWIDVLELHSGYRLQPDSNFFHLGGDSLSALKAAARVSACFSVDMPVATLWGSPTIRALARELQQRIHSPQVMPSAPVQVDASMPLPLSTAQQRLWIVHQINPSGAQHNVSCAVWLDGNLDEAALATALNHLVARHEVLQTEFIEVDGTPVQRIHPDVKLPLSIKEIAGDAEQTRDMCIAFAYEQRRVAFDLRCAPLAKATLLRRSRDRHALVLTLHHIACDGGSAEILLRDFCAFYEALSSGHQPALPPPAMRYVDFAAWQNAMLSTPEAEEHLKYWRLRLKDLPENHRLIPVQQTADTTELTGTVGRCLPPALTRQLRALKQAHGVTMFMLVLTALKALLHDLTGRTDIVIGTDVSDRPLAESWNVVGFFINQLALRTSLEGDPSFEVLMDRVRSTCIEAYTHQSVPYDRLVRELLLDARRERTLFQVKLVFQNPLKLAFNIGGLAVRPMPINEGAGEFDLIINIAEQTDVIVLNAEFRNDCFTSDSITRMLSRLERILAVSASNSSLRLSELHALTRDQETMVTRRTRIRFISAPDHQEQEHEFIEIKQ